MRLFKQRNDNYIFPEVYRTIFFDIRISLFYIVIIRRISLYLSVFRFIRYRTFFTEFMRQTSWKINQQKTRNNIHSFDTNSFLSRIFRPFVLASGKKLIKVVRLPPPPLPARSRRSHRRRSIFAEICKFSILSYGNFRCVSSRRFVSLLCTKSCRKAYSEHRKIVRAKNERNRRIE